MDENILKDAQYRKGLSIAFFNATNAAIEMCKGLNIFEKATKKKITDVRDWLLEEHRNYYAAIIAKVGNNYDVNEAVKKLKAVKSKEELHTVWLMFSEDERQDAEISKVAQEMKSKIN